MGRKKIGNHLISCTTFNILAPIYKRPDHQDQSCRESDNKANWVDRNQRILDMLLYERSAIICLQEFWVGNEELVNLYDKGLGDAGYMTFKLARTNNRGDGLLLDVKDANWTLSIDMFLQVGGSSLLTAVHKDYFRVINDQPFLLHGFGDRVAHLLHLEVATPFLQHRNNSVRQEILVVNTHLLFPHDSSLCLERLRQVYKILEYVESYQKEKKLHSLPILLCGDWNGSKKGHVYEFLRSQGFISSYDTAHQYTDTDAQKWVSHRNHRGNICGVDFIWLLNPNSYRKVLKVSWSETLFGMFKCLLRRESLTADDAFAILKADSSGDYITRSAFFDALRQLGVIGEQYQYGLSMEEAKDLWEQADIDKNGVIDYKEFQLRIWNSTLSHEGDDINNESREDIVNSTEQSVGLSVKNAVLFPPEVEKGMWPEDYSLSDHARLTVVFSPVTMSCSRLTSS